MSQRLWLYAGTCSFTGCSVQAASQPHSTCCSIRVDNTIFYAFSCSSRKDHSYLTYCYEPVRADTQQALYRAADRYALPADLERYQSCHHFSRHSINDKCQSRYAGQLHCRMVIQLPNRHLRRMQWVLLHCDWLCACVKASS